MWWRSRDGLHVSTGRGCSEKTHKNVSPAAWTDTTFRGPLLKGKAVPCHHHTLWSSPATRDSLEHERLGCQACGTCPDYSGICKFTDCYHGRQCKRPSPNSPFFRYPGISRVPLPRSLESLAVWAPPLLTQQCCLCLHRRRTAWHTLSFA